jgi:hypothetical protein
VSSAKRWETFTAVFFWLFTEEPSKKPLATALSIKRLKASMTKTNNKGERESPCQTPQELLKKPQGLPFIKTENLMVEMQKYI